MKSYPTVMIVSIPLSDIPASIPPVGSLCIVTALRKMGVDTEFYDIDSLRPSHEDILKHIQSRKPDILGVSAIVSTSYAFTKRLTQGVKKILPETMIVLGGNLAASSEVVLRKAGVDVCCMGEGEITMPGLVELYAERGINKVGMSEVPGIVYLDDNEDLKTTGFAPQLKNDEMLDIDWSIIDENGTRDVHFHNDAEHLFAFSHDPRFYEPKRYGKYHGNLFSSKGCVARCTFCHRFGKGMRFVPLDILKVRLEDFISRFNLGFLTWTDENFGVHDRQLEPFCELMKELDLLWKVSGVRVRQIKPEKLKMMRDAGCVAITYGMETGSEKMLKIMEKKVELKHNYDAARWTTEASLRHGVQLVVGMPGESPSTIQETIKFCQEAYAAHPSMNPISLSANYATALPGTPLYEIARHKGYIGTSYDAEEKYLIDASDKIASNPKNKLNFTDCPRVVVEAWKYQIIVGTNYFYTKTFGHTALMQHLIHRYEGRQCIRDNDDIYFVDVERIRNLKLEWSKIDEATKKADMNNLKAPSLMKALYSRNLYQAMFLAPKLFYHLSCFFPLAFILLGKKSRGTEQNKWMEFMDYIAYLIKWSFRKKESSVPYQSLRKTVKDEGTIPSDNILMQGLRDGR